MKEETKIKIRNWISKHGDGKRSKLILFLTSFADSSFSPIPPDVFLIPVLMSEEARKKWWEYSWVVFIASIFGGVVGYGIGFWFFSLFGEKIINFYHLQNAFLEVSGFFSQNAFLAVFVGAFTPLPYKIFTITAGLFKIDFIVFLFASIMGRGIRFFLVGFFMKLFGERVTNTIFKYFKIVTLLAIAILVLVIFA
ncbi:VTT domain-containing protein [Patescibacteria group bacterium]|nr:VTT domain-containing protein [Patescibacteria group bacterium]MBU4057544.1 VTT domain-containing protein [Patescibacteria group bacterium]MBU4115868.1 VTT domain-containing protein [Patescibacteria group bacterium]